MKIIIKESIAKISIRNIAIRKKLLKVFGEISKSETLADLPYNKIHHMKGSHYGELSLPITSRARLLFIPKDCSSDCLNIINRCNNNKITTIEITGMSFNHYQKIHSS